MKYKVNHLIYASGPDLINTIRIAITLTEPVSAEVLRFAADRAVQRYPYFSVKLIREGAEYAFVPNCLPFVITPNGRTVTLGTEESNGHLFAFAYDGCRLYVDTSHFVSDGNGLFPFLKTVLYYYLSFLHPEETFDTASIALAGSEVPPEEADDDPYPDYPLPEAPFGMIARPEKVFLLNDQPQGYGHMDGWTSYVFRIGQKTLMKHASSLDGSPATFITSLIYRAIMDCHPENHLPVVCGMQHQFRKALGKPLSHLCHVNVVPIVFPDRLRERELEFLDTVARGRIIIGTDDANDILTVNEHVRNGKRIREMSLSEKHDYMRNVILNGIGVNTFEVSYTGRVQWSGLDRYVTDVVPYFDLTLSGGLTVEIFSVGETFTVNIMQRYGIEAYTDRFAELLSQTGVTYERKAPERFRLCSFRLPE